MRINFKNIFQKFVKRNVGKEIETFSDPLPYPIIPIHFLEKSLENPSLFFAQNYNKMGRCMLGTGRFRGVPEDQEVCPWENQRHCLRTLTTVKSPLHRSGLFVLHFHQQIYMRVLPAEMYKLLELSQNKKLYCTKQSIDFCRFS